MKTILALLIGIIIKSGTITNDNNNTLVYYVSCPDSTECYTELQLETGFYTYHSQDKSDSIKLCVVDTAVYQIGDQTIRLYPKQGLSNQVRY